MARKTYTPEQYAQLKQSLLDCAVKSYGRRGIKAVKLPEILKEVGISKPFFYSFYRSLDELILAVIDHQRISLIRLAEDTARTSSCMEESFRRFLEAVMAPQSDPVFIMTPEEEIWLYRHLSEENYRTFQKGQLEFFTRLLEILGIDSQQCDMKIVVNLLLSMLILHNSTQETLPFLFHDRLKESTALQRELLTSYLARFKAGASE